MVLTDCATKPDDGSEQLQRRELVAAVAPSGEPILPIARDVVHDSDKVKLGERLFNETKLSRDNTVSCATCHDLTSGGDDGTATSIGVGGAVGVANAPTVFNSGLNFRQFWDGRATTLEAQIDGPIHNPTEFGFEWPGILSRLQDDPSYNKSFSDLYPAGITSETVKDAIAAFERSLTTPDSPFDRYLRGESDALTAGELHGYERFKLYGCVSCHQGAAVGGNMFQTIGILGDYLGDRGEIKEIDRGRFNVTGDEADLYVFKVPSLRNVAVTDPYLHDGSVETLDEMVRIMAKYQVGRILSDGEINSIVEFLHTLTGRYRGQSL